MEVTVRKAEKEDASQLSDLFVEFTGAPSDITAMRETIELISKRPEYYVAVACEQERVVGTAMGIICRDLCGDGRPFMLIENVVVAQSYHGEGIGKRLMNELEQFGRENRCKYVILVSEADRTDSHHFYESLGYPSGEEVGFKKKLDE
ncbi:GNAT family N-acetyltransferase [Brevibacillus choshinensis]|uniref:GNAT family N-acetyltransferase n=1 Tax=Brevibacillus choshinensis TaxID=54911 RepID=A0ABX7FLT7_BRECH|nr:GNAT family N-acetyltransferase [Brevibacillus choshinensis]QRG66698.1 GNAT family N-acetyltransferase [Brevibacillus choshinensis]